jgi:serine protease AprX
LFPARFSSRKHQSVQVKSHIFIEPDAQRHLELGCSPIKGRTLPKEGNMKPIKHTIVFCLAVVMVALLLGPAPSGTAASQAKAQPQLIQLAAEQPDQLVEVIVQKLGQGHATEAMAAHLGGSVTKDLQIINAFAAEMPARAALALANDDHVSWVSLDAKVQQSVDTPSFITWASSVGSSVNNTFNNASLAVDSSLGPNETYASGFNAKGSFTGFNAEVTPDQKIGKVEVALKLYTALIPVLGQDPVITVSVNGTAGKAVTLSHLQYFTCVGKLFACTVYVDVTASRSWLWSDFTQPLEVTIDQSKFLLGWTMYYDAVGLKVTGASGVDNSDLFADATRLTSSVMESFSLFGESNSATPAIDTSKLKNVYNQAVRATDVWNAATHTLRGDGVTVAVVDSGIVRNRDYDNRLIKSVNFNRSYHDSADRYGHGTFVASIIAGDGTHSRQSYMGIAPEANLLNVRVSDDNGGATESDVVLSLQWILKNKNLYNIRIVNLSLNSTSAQSYHTSPMDAAVEILWFNGIVVVTSAGNNGTGPVYAPANDPFVISVGAVDDKGTASLNDDTVASFSASGMTSDGFAKPDLVAPGKNIVALLPENTRLTLGKGHPANRVDDNYFKMSGTSMAAPIVSGAAALLLQSEPGLTPDQVKFRLTSTANNNWAGYTAAKAGAGTLDVYAAVTATSTDSANTGINASRLLTTGSAPVNSSVSWNSVSWNSVSWNSVSWNSVSWNSVSWNSVSWNSDYWGN